jgi:hypothetical protein
MYTDVELRTLLAETARRGPLASLRPATCRTLFGLLAATRLRISEALALTRADVDLEAGVLDIRDAKCHQHRFGPLHATACRICRRTRNCETGSSCLPAPITSSCATTVGLLMGGGCRMRCVRFANSSAGSLVKIKGIAGYRPTGALLKFPRTL